jgi:hypothetical protein
MAGKLTVGSLILLEDIVGVKESRRGRTEQLSAMTLGCTGKSKASELFFAFDKVRI